MRMKYLFLLLSLTVLSSSIIILPQEEKKEESEKKEKKEEEKKEEKEATKETEKEPKEETKEIKVPEDKKDSEEKKKDIALEGLDTVSVREPEGNWLLKRIWWEKAQKKYEKIKNLASKIVGARVAFFKKRNNVDRNLFDPFYTEIGLDQGQLKEIVTDLVDRMRQEREEDVTLSQKERAFLEMLKSEENKLKQLQADVKGIRKLDVAIDDDLTRLIQEIDRAKKYEENAWQLFKSIAKELSHKKARELYYKMDALWKNVKGIDAYIRGAFSRHFDTIVENAKTQVKRIKDIAAKFKAQGVDLKKEFKKLEGEPDELDEAAVSGKDRAQAKGEDKDSVEDDEEDDLYEDETGWLGTIWNGITWPFRKVWSAISSLWS